MNKSKNLLKMQNQQIIFKNLITTKIERIIKLHYQILIFILNNNFIN